MRRVLQWLCLCGGATLLLITAGIGLARRNVDGPLHWAIVTGRVDNGAFENALYLLEPKSGHLQRLTPAFYYIRMVGQVGDWIYYAAGTTDDGLPTVYRVQSGQPPQVIVTEAGLSNEAALSPDGRWLIFHRGLEDTYHLYSVPTAGGPIIPLTESFATEGVALLAPTFQQIAEWIAFEAFNSAGRSDIYAVRVDGTTALRNLTDTWEIPPHLLGIENSPGLFVQALPSDPLIQLDPATGTQRILEGVRPAAVGSVTGLADVLFFRDPSNVLRAAQLADGSLLWEERDVFGSWISPAGQWILLFHFPPDDAPPEWILRRGDGSIRQTLNTPFLVTTSDLLGAWSPDETRAVVATSSVDGNGNDFWRLEAATGSWQKIGQTPHSLLDFRWSPNNTHLLLHELINTGSQLAWLRVADGQRRVIEPAASIQFEDFAAWGPKIEKAWSAVQLVIIGGILWLLGILAGRRSKAHEVGAENRGRDDGPIAVDAAGGLDPAGGSPP